MEDISDRLVEDARIFLLIVERQRTSYDGALDGLVRDAFGSADRLRSAAAAARARGRPDAEVDLLERATHRAAPGEDRQPGGSTTSVGSTAGSAGGTSPATHA